MRFPEDESDVFTPSNHPRRRPTINRKRKTSEAAEDHADSSAREDAKKKEPVAADTGENSCSFIEFWNEQITAESHGHGFLQEGLYASFT